MSDAEKIKSLASDAAWKHTPDSVRDECIRDLRDMGLSEQEIKEAVKEAERKQ